MSTTIPANNLKHSLDIPFLTEKIKLEAGTYKMGDIIEYDYSGKKGKKIETANKIYGVMAENIEITSAVTSGVVYISGIFNSKAVDKGSTVSSLDDLKEHARSLNIFFR